MSEPQIIRDGNDVIAIVILADLPAEGVHFITPQSYPFQVGVLGHKAGTVLKAHGHKKLKIETDVFQEILIIQAGRIGSGFVRDAAPISRDSGVGTGRFDSICGRRARGAHADGCEDT